MRSSKRMESIHSTQKFVEGVLLSEQTVTTSILKKAEQEPSFVKVYVEDIGRLSNLQPQTRNVVDQLLKSMDYNNQVVVNVGYKRQICKALDIYVNTKAGRVLGVNVIDQHISKLIIAGFMQRTEKGVYRIDANLFAKGQWLDIKNIRLQIDYSADGRIITSTINKSKLSK